MLIDNIDISDRLINREIGDNQAWLKTMSHDDPSERAQWVAIERIEALFSMRKNSFTVKWTQFLPNLS